MNNDIPWLERPEIVSVSDYLTNSQFTWLFDGVLIERAPVDVDGLLKSLFQTGMAESDFDDGSLWTCYVYKIPKNVGDLPEFKYLRGSHRGKVGYTLTACPLHPGDVIVCHRKASYNPGPVRAYEHMYSRKDSTVTR